jgi:hypothetical protein
LAAVTAIAVTIGPTITHVQSGWILMKDAQAL